TAYFGLLRAGMVAVPINTGYTSRETARLLGDADAKALLCEERTLRAAEEAVAESDHALVDPAGLDALVASGRADGPVEARSGGEDLAVLLHTSGESGPRQSASV